MTLIKNFAKSILGELKIRKFGFQYNQVEQFYQSQWQSGERCVYYLLYRWIWAAFFIGVFITCLILQFSAGKLFIFLTNWGIILCLLTHVIGAVLVTRWHFQLGVDPHEDEGKITSHTPKLVKLYWLLHVVALSLSLVITTIYWTFLHGKMDKPMRFPVMSFITHCLNAVFMMVDFLVVAFPVRMLHAVYAMILPIVYCIFTVIYFYCGGTDEYGKHYVYPILDWTNPVRGMITFAGVFVLYVIYGFALFALYKLKRFLHRTFSAVGKPHVIGIF